VNTLNSIKVVRLLAVSVALLVAAIPARALPIQPPGLTPGENYHWMFVTRGAMDSTSADITVYNAFVTAEAALNPGLAGLTWHAIASTEFVDARINAPVSGPVFLLDGTKFTDGFVTMWDGAGKATSPRVDQFGVERPPDGGSDFWVWTGTDDDGTAEGLGLGGQQDNWVGRYTAQFLGDWIIEVHISENSLQPLYALSSPLKAQSVPTVPEPSTLSSIAIAGLAFCGSAARRFRRRNPCIATPLSTNRPAAGHTRP
jgi:hypothetical protein